MKFITMETKRENYSLDYIQKGQPEPGNSSRPTTPIKEQHGVPNVGGSQRPATPPPPKK
jgi:hypothetical protein